MPSQTETETKLAFLEQAHDELNDVVMSQQAEIHRLTLVVEAIRHRVKALSDGGGESVFDAGDERPPHY